MINTMDIEAKIKEKRDRITEIDNQIKTLREERKQCVVTASKLETALTHVNEILGEKTEVEEIPQNH